MICTIKISIIVVTSFPSYILLDRDEQFQEPLRLEGRSESQKKIFFWWVVILYRVLQFQVKLQFSWDGKSSFFLINFGIREILMAAQTIWGGLCKTFFDFLQKFVLISSLNKGFPGILQISCFSSLSYKQYDFKASLIGLVLGLKSYHELRLYIIERARQTQLQF